MPRLMSFSLTTPQMYATLHGTPGDPKSVSRRWGTWLNLKPGDIVEAVEKAMGLRKGDKIVRIGLIEITETRLEPLRRMLDDHAYGQAEVVKEGFPHLTPEQFVEMLCRHGGKTPDDEINRIAFVPYVSGQLRLL